MPRNSHSTKKRILQAAKKLFSQYGYKNVGTRAIAHEAQVNITLINRYFGSKKNLFKCVIDTLPQNVTSLHEARERAKDIGKDFITGILNLPKEELKLILFSIVDPEVDDIIKNFFIERIQKQSALMGSKEGKARVFMILSLLSGIALLSNILENEYFDQQDKSLIEHNFSSLLDELYKN